MLLGFVRACFVCGLYARVCVLCVHVSLVLFTLADRLSLCRCQVLFFYFSVFCCCCFLPRIAVLLFRCYVAAFCRFGCFSIKVAVFFFSSCFLCFCCVFSRFLVFFLLISVADSLFSGARYYPIRTKCGQRADVLFGVGEDNGALRR